MQRRAAAMYFAFFIIVGAGAYGLVATTSTPQVSLDGPTYAQGDTVTLESRTYTVSGISEESSGGGGHGGGGGEATVTGTLAWTNESAVVSTDLSNGSTVPSADVAWENQQASNSSYLVHVPNVTAMEDVSSPSEFTLVQQRDVAALATADPALYNTTVTIDGVRYVTYRANDTNVPVEEYFGPVETRTFGLGDSLRYQGNETTVERITADTVTLTRRGSETTEIELTEGGNFTVMGTGYFAHFPDASSVQILSADAGYGSYAAQHERIDAYEERMLGLWGVAELSAIAAIVLLGTAFLPVRG